MKLMVKIFEGVIYWGGLCGLAFAITFAFYRAGNGDVEAIGRGFLGLALVGIPLLVLLLGLSWVLKKLKSGKEAEPQ